MSHIHIVVGSNADFDDFLVPALQNKTRVHWPIPKKARAGDDVLFLIPSQHGSICAAGSVLDAPSKSKRWHGKYAASIVDIHKLRKPIPIETLRETFPDWGYPRYARGYTTVQKEFVAALEEILTKHQ